MPYAAETPRNLKTGADHMRSMRSEKPRTKDSNGKYRWLIVSLVRHGESMNNVYPTWNAKNDDRLTLRGRVQASTLGLHWRDTRIDAIYASTLTRARVTAHAIADANNGDLSVRTEPLLVERHIGSVARVHAARGDHKAARREQHGPGAGKLTHRDRMHRPGGGGESLDDVARRAKAVLLSTLKHHFEPLGEKPEGLALPPERCTAPTDDVPEGIPHVVLVSHNVFICEFYETLVNWGKPVSEHRSTCTDYPNTAWWVVQVPRGLCHT
ncbi:phosphoglycerate mutase-like protein [Dentipellis sp. KUC8613]|nr:phosphoglycerate mutase-like protein [Dentipellis sp. KUC8613]